MIFEDPINPKDCDSYEHYLELKEMRENMDDLRDQTCGRDWCRRETWCLWENIDGLQEMFNREFFGEHLQPEDLLITEEDLKMCRIRGCDALPVEWFDPEHPAHKALSWLIDMSVALYFHKNNRIFPLRLLRKFCHVPVDAVGKTVYLITAGVVKGRSWSEAERGMLVIEGFLKDPRLFDRTVSALLTERGNELARCMK